MRNTTRVIPKSKDNSDKNVNKHDVMNAAASSGKSNSGIGALGGGLSSSGGSIPNTSASLSVFLRKASGVCETLLEENRHNREDGSEMVGQFPSGLFGPSSQWLSLGAGLESPSTGSRKSGKSDLAAEVKSSERNDKGQGLGQGLGQGIKGYGEALATRMTVALRFSPLQPHILITAHRHVHDDINDVIEEKKSSEGHTTSKSSPLTLDHPTSLKPTNNSLASKGIYCVWDVTAPAVPLHVLAAVGQPSAVCFSVAQVPTSTLMPSTFMDTLGDPLLYTLCKPSYHSLLSTDIFGASGDL